MEDIAELFGRLWPDCGPTPLIELPQLARLCGVARVFVKDESRRPLGSFKSLGGTYAGMRALARAMGDSTVAALITARPEQRVLPTLICASAGNHGLAVAAAAEIAGAKARIYLAGAAAEARVRRLTVRGAQVVRVAGAYDDAVEAADLAAAQGDGLLIADIADSWDDQAVRDVMAGYDLMAREIVKQLPNLSDAAPTHVFVQAGVGGLAAALAHGLCGRLALAPKIVVVEPSAARCVAAGIAARRPVRLLGDPTSAAEMLSCARASAPALDILLRHNACAIGVDEAMLLTAVAHLRQAGGPATSPSGATGLAGLLAARRRPAEADDVLADSQVLLIVTEGPTADLAQLASDTVYR